MAGAPILIGELVSIDEIQEVLDKRLKGLKMEYLVKLKTAGKGAEFWIPASDISGDIHSLIGIGRRGSTSASSTPSASSVKGTKVNEAKKRKRSAGLRKKSSSGSNSASDTSDADKNTVKKAFTHHLKREESAESIRSLNTTTLDGTVMADDIEEEEAAKRSREAFQVRLDKISGPPVTIFNDIDNSSPNLNFRFVEESIICDGVVKASDESMYGCTCKPDNGRHIGCEYTMCECLDQMNVRKFPYVAVGERAGTLRNQHLCTRDAIFECNRFCNCDDNCKNKLVQWGRKVPLEIFKTSNRGWGLRCPIKIRKGEFIDIYKGEIITNSEANRREIEKKRIGGKENYLYVMEKFAEANDIPADKLYTVDGEFFGGPTRFMNHSCDPNCRQFTVSYHHGDMFIYDLAFFAINAIPANTELTFNYTDIECIEPKRRKSKRATDCLCGSKNCRGYIWP